jgi:hypothetical protein
VARVTRGLYGLLTALLGLGYAGAVLVLGQLAGRDRNSLAVAGGTLAVAVLVQPARRRIQQAVDRRFNRRKYNTAETIEAYSTRLRDEVDLDTLSTEAAGGRYPDDAANHGVLVAPSLGPRNARR